MKRITILILVMCSGFRLHAKPDTARFVYVVQNPLFFGQGAKAWFEIEGMLDNVVMKKINDTLRKVFFEKTELDSFDGWATMRPDEKTPKGYTDFSFSNGQTYGNGWIRFKNSDSTIRLSHADGYYGAGKNLGGFEQEIAPGRLAWIGIYPSHYLEGGSFHERAINLAFDLRTGTVIQHEFIVRINPAKRDSLEQLLLMRVEEIVDNKGMFREGKIIAADKLSDTVIVSMPQVIRWMNDVKPNYPIAISRYYTAHALIASSNTWTEWKPMACLTFDEAVPFFLEQDWNKLLAL